MTRCTTLAALALASTLALAGCAAGTTEQDTGAAAGTPAPAASAPAGTGTTPATAEPIDAEHDDGDVMFAQMMIPHHEQAVDMSEMLLAKDDVPAEVAGLARQVADAQGPEIERMHRMLETWGEQPLADSGDMAGMDHGSGSGMSGMMTPEDLQALEAAEGADAARLYLEQMTVHHEGAVEMARDQVENGRNAQAVELARQVVEDQEAEIAEMERMRQELPDGS
ncbi:DUF305 domain-containing protein [Kocuria sp. NPDC057446]|uniref:DUF305 domain-containing protein n=1 Tax=Kocuria sp. NPDC057446 TaxID=3346137 RepID=UPI00367721E4